MLYCFTRRQPALRGGQLEKHEAWPLPAGPYSLGKRVVMEFLANKSAGYTSSWLDLLEEGKWDPGWGHCCLSQAQLGSSCLPATLPAEAGGPRSWAGQAGWAAGTGRGFLQPLNQLLHLTQVPNQAGLVLSGCFSEVFQGKVKARDTVNSGHSPASTGVSLPTAPVYGSQHPGSNNAERIFQVQMGRTLLCLLFWHHPLILMSNCTDSEASLYRDHPACLLEVSPKHEHNPLRARPTSHCLPPSAFQHLS